MSLFTSFIQDKTITANTDVTELAADYANHIIAIEKPSFTAWEEREEWDSKTLSKAIEAALETHGTENQTATTFKGEFEYHLIEQLDDEVSIYQDDKRRDYIAGNVAMDEQTAIDYLSAIIPSFDEEVFKDNVFDAIVEHCVNNDTSSIIDSIGNREYIEMSFSPAMDTTVEYDSFCCSVETAFLTEYESTTIDPSIEALFKLANVSPLVFAEYLQGKGYEEEVVEKYRAINDQVSIDTDHKQALTCEDVLDILENATYGGTSVVFGFIDAREFIEKYESGKTVIVAGNPQIGIVDWVNGSGYLARGDETKVVLSPRNISVETSHRYNVDSIFGFTVRSTLINLK